MRESVILRPRLRFGLVVVGSTVCLKRHRVSGRKPVENVSSFPAASIVRSRVPRLLIAVATQVEATCATLLGVAISKVQLQNLRVGLVMGGAAHPTLLMAVLVLVLASPLFAELPGTEYVFPLGGRQGTKVAIRVGG